jgi:hypothetical protein
MKVATKNSWKNTSITKPKEIKLKMKIRFTEEEFNKLKV